ncbi:MULTISPECIES: ATP-binding protein [unclassified Fibrobacter]|uniref:ATP-binding protein n=1 Tax=unclassified Fibrobacter TaxID=2634177 RepID=UPI0025B90817|nr:MULTISPECIES: ATP-binding protein [unclassified Fibrobacter]
MLVNGARQVGKTFIIDVFGRENYKSYIYLNLFKNPEYKQIFEGELEPNEIYKRISLLVKKTNFIEGDTLIFIDEIQVCSKARTALKFLAMDDRYDIIASGSLLGLHYNKLGQNSEEISIPVGYEREVEMHSLDFEEFLWANDVSEESIENLKEYYTQKKALPDAINNLYQNKLREYLVVGGMPEVVNTFISTTNFQQVFNAQQKIFKAYEDDIQHYATNTERPKIRACYYSLPRQLSKEYSKFQYKTVEKNGNAKKYGNALDWLVDAGLVKLVHNVSLPEMPLKAYEQPENFKVYVTDIGLATHQFGFETQSALVRKELKGHAKGGIYENLIFDILNKRGLNLNYYKNGENTQEIEFVFEHSGKVVPVEVKSKNGQTTSMNEFIKKYSPSLAIKLIDGNIGIDGNKVSLPQFMAMFLP